MAIYLDEQVGPHLKYLLQKQLKNSPKDFVADRLLKMVEADDERKKKIALCDHQWNEMTGHHVQCDKCQCLLNGEEWISDSFLRERGADDPPFSTHIEESAIPHSTLTDPNVPKLL